ncbi:hypothetical protein [Burkholderia thailandensis]|uniref:hypothetical protein n=1 Tax=Burkholderia thailandensis TaxID=57975 RepID=UPI0012DA13DD|nr:hypothetical protein [Burkholderia thailandensis]
MEIVICRLNSLIWRRNQSRVIRIALRAACLRGGGDRRARRDLANDPGERPEAAARCRAAECAQDLLLRTKFDASGLRIRPNSKKYQSGV